MKVAVIGSGVSGLVAAHRLQRHHEVTVFEAKTRIGGHTHTVEVDEEGRRLAVDTGFIVFNQTNYPRFTALLAELGVNHHASNMSFSVRDERNGLEYRGSSLDTLFAQRRNLLRPGFYRMIADIFRFYREAPRAVRNGGSETLGDFLGRGRYSAMFIEDHILPMAAALWSSDRIRAEAMPLEFVVRFFDNHGMLRLRDRPEWRVVSGGSQEYVKALIRPFRDRIHTGTPVDAVRRRGSVQVKPRGGEWVDFDRVILATHSDQALDILEDPDPAEREILGSIRYQANDVVLHTDTRLLPRIRRAWSSWNYHVLERESGRSTVTYLMNMLQGFRARRAYMVTLNRTGDIDPARVLRRFEYHHPIFDRRAVEAQKRVGEINGNRDTFFCGAYLGFGFHEDGVRSGEKAAELLRGMRRAA